MTDSRAKKQADNIYFTASKANFGIDNIPAEFENIRGSALVDVPNDYYCYVERFAISGQTIPLFVNYPGDPKRNFIVTIQRFPLVGMVRVPGPKYAQIVQNEPVFDPAPGYVVYVDQYLNMINNALASAHTQAYGVTTINPPFLDYSNENNNIVLVVDQDYDIDQTKIYVNGRLYPKVNAIINTAVGFGANPDGADYFFNYSNARFKRASGYFEIATYPVYVVQSDIFGIDDLFDAKALVVITKNIPIFPEYITNRTNNQQSSILQLFQVSLTDNLKNKYSQIEYHGSLFKMTDMFSSSPLSTIDYKVFIEFADGTMIPMQLAPTNYMEMKIVFIKRDRFNIMKALKSDKFKK